MTTHRIDSILAAQRAYFATGATLSPAFRIAMLKKLKDAVLRHEEELIAALGQDLSNWFIRRIEDKDTGDITVKGAKTGFVNQSGCCAVSYGERSDGHGYYVVTGNAYSQWRSIYDHADLYAKYCQGS